MSLRTLQRRVAKVEKARKPRPSPFTLWYGSFDLLVEKVVLPDLERGALDREFIILVAALRSWEHNGVWDGAYAT